MAEKKTSIPKKSKKTSKTKPKPKQKKAPSALQGEVVRKVEAELLPADDLPVKPLTKKPAPFMEYDEVVSDEEEESVDPSEDAEDSEPSDDLAESNDLVPLEEVDHALVSASRAISPTDPLRRYLDEVRRYPLLTPEEEIELARKLHETGDLEAAKRLVQANLRLVVKIAFEYKSVYANAMDLIQEGNIGLMKAVSKYDPTKGARVGYYSSWWIRSYILKYLLENFRLIRVGTTAAQKKLFFHLMREKERLEAQGVHAGPKLLADRLQVREKDIVEMEKRLGSSGNEVSIDAPVSGRGDRPTSFKDFLEDTHESVDEQLAHEELLGLVRKRLPAFEKTLNDREKKLLKDRLLSENPKTLQEVADLYGLTRERARQIEAGVISKLREFLKDTIR